MERYTLINNNGMHVTLLSLGARVASIQIPIGNMVQEMTATFSSIEDFELDLACMGATPGRFANRIAGARFDIDGISHNINANEGINTLHGGADNFSMRHWSLVPSSQHAGGLRMHLVSEHGDQGFPGTLNAYVDYQLTDENELIIQFIADSDQDTAINLCNHCYFNLGEDDARHLELTMFANHYLPKTADGIPTGEIRPVIGTPFDLRTTNTIEQHILPLMNAGQDSDQGFDHCFACEDDGKMKLQASLYSTKNKIKLSVLSDQPGVQLYTGQYLGAPHQPFAGTCLESQNFPNAINQDGFPDAVLKAGEVYCKTAIYKFEIE